MLDDGEEGEYEQDDDVVTMMRLIVRFYGAGRLFVVESLLSSSILRNGRDERRGGGREK